MLGYTFLFWMLSFLRDTLVLMLGTAPGAVVHNCTYCQMIMGSDLPKGTGIYCPQLSLGAGLGEGCSGACAGRQESW